MKKTIVLLAILLTACAGVAAQSKDEGRIKQSYVLLETVIIPTRAPTQTATIAPPTETPEPTPIERSNFPHISDVAYNQIPNHAPGSAEDANDQGGAFMTGGDQHYAYYEQFICVDYVDLRRVPDLNQPPRAYSVYGDVVHVHQRWNEWAFIGGEYWVELVYLCDF